ncbi:MAG TPA: hypothetical protein VFA65_02710 [Bryobacteraceae bacterium]|nr:hypothetical protein [Bryobacteraceae bacterium]
MTASVPSTSYKRHAGPHIGVVACVFVGLFIVGLFPVTAFGGKPYFPGPAESLDTIAAFFQARPSAVLLCAFFQFGAAIPLGLFTASAVSQLRFLGVRAAGPNIALFGGFATAFTMITASSVLWTMTYPGIAQAGPLLQALYRFAFALGGPGFSVPFGLLIAGISVSAGLARLLPKWLAIVGVVIAAIGELSWLQIVFPKLLPLIPLTRFPGFIWLIIAGFALPRAIKTSEAMNRIET